MNSKMIERILDITMIILGTIFIIQIILKLIGHSPTEMQLLYIGFSGIMIYLIGFTFYNGQFMGEVRNFMKVAENSFKKFGEVEKKIRANFKEIDKKFQKIDKRLDTIELKIDKST